MLLETGNEQGKKHPYNKILCNLAERILRNIPLKEVCFLKKIPKNRKLEILIFEDKYSLKEHREQAKF